MSHPLPVHHFQVEWGGTRIGFAEVSGLDLETEAIEYREGSSPVDSAVKVPGIQKYANVTFKRGILRNDNEFADWYKTIAAGAVERRDIVVSLLDHEHQPVVIWKLRNAWPVKLSGPTLDATSSEVAIEMLEIAHEGLTVENG